MLVSANFPPAWRRRDQGATVFVAPRKTMTIPHGLQRSPIALAASSGVAAGFYQLLKTWVEARNGRKLRIKIGDVEVEATQMAEEEVFRILNFSSRKLIERRFGTY